MSNGQDTYRIAWVGREDRICESLLEAFEQTCDQLGRTAEVLRSDELQQEQLFRCQRIVLTASTRHEYPHDWARQLATAAGLEAPNAANNIVPWGVVTGSWHVGSRRSGEGPVTHFQLPWFRWWDGWMSWFFPDHVGFGPKAQSLFSPIVTPLDLASSGGNSVAVYDKQGHRPNGSEPNRQVRLLCACPNTAQMWTEQARLAGWSTEPVPSLVTVDSRAASSVYPVLWDDSCLPCLPDTSLQAWVGEQIAPTLGQLQLNPIMVALGLENLFLWPSFVACGCQTLFVKPSHGLALANYLHYSDRQRQFA